MRAVRALLAFLLLPGVIGGLVPWLLYPDDADFRVSGAVVIAVGLALLLWCVRDFFVTGRGTLAPWDPPIHLVRVGLYRYSRNPMYVAVTTILCGWALGFHSTILAAYAVIVAIAFHLRVTLAEEPTLARLFGEEWTRYRTSVRRWL